MSKKYLIIIILILFLMLSLISIKKFDINTFTSYTIKENYVYTKAICNETNFCQDYIIYCKEGEVIKKIPIEGAKVQHTKEWKDPRVNETNNDLC